MNFPKLTKRATTLAAGIVIATSLLAVLLTAWGLPPHFPSEPHKTIGRIMAQKAASLLGPGGEIIVFARDTFAFPQPAADFQLASFARELKKSSLQIGSIKRLQSDPLRQMELPSGDLFELMRRANPASVIVSFMGPPFLTREQLAKLGPVHCKMIAFCPGEIYNQTDLRALFESGLLQGAIVGRPQARPAQPRDQVIPTAFERLYLDIKGSNLAELPTRGDRPL